MRGAVWALCFATLGFAAAGARAQPAPDFPPNAPDPFTDPFFTPAGAIVAKPAPRPATRPTVTATSDLAAANEPPPPLPPPAVERITSACAPCACKPGFTYWANTELLIGRTRGPSVAPIVTTGPASAGLLAGAIGQPTTLPIFGGHRILNDWRSGLRVEAGMWFDDEHRTGLSGRFYSLFAESERFAGASGAAVVNVPHFIPVGGAAVQIPVFVGFPGITAGTVQTNARTIFSGGDVNFRRLLDRGEHYRIEFLAGYRQLYLDDELGSAFTVAGVGLPGLILPRLSGTDAIRSRNDFCGPQLGLFASTNSGRWTLEGHTALAMGVTASDLNFVRTRTGMGNPTATTALLTAAGVPPLVAGGLAAATTQFPLAGTSTGGSVTYFGLVGEGGLRLLWRATDHLRLSAGYGFLYWNNVRRAQEAYASSALLRPRASDFSTHLFSLGLDLRY